MRFGMLGRAGRLLVGCTMMALGACSDAERVADPAETAPAVTWPRGEVQVLTATDTIPLQVEIAATDEQRAYGLMNRASLSQSAGMLFVYQDTQPPEGSFWMFNTRIPLDIAFLDGDGTIVSIRQMEPCASPYPQWCPSYEAGAPFRYALEVNHGWFASHGVQVGDRVTIEM